MCPDCPLLARLNDTKVVHAAEAALNAFNTQTNGSYFQLVEVSRAQHVVRLRPCDKLEQSDDTSGMHVVRAEQVQGQQREGKDGGGEKSPGGYENPDCHQDLNLSNIKQPDAASPQFLGYS